MKSYLRADTDVKKMVMFKGMCMFPNYRNHRNDRNSRYDAIRFAIDLYKA